MARGDGAIAEHDAPAMIAGALARGFDSPDVGLADLAAKTSEHLRIGLDHRARRIHGSRLGVQETGCVDRQDVRLERGDRLTIEQFALDAELGKERLLLFGGLRRMAAPGLEPAGLADALPRIGLHDP